MPRLDRAAANLAFVQLYSAIAQAGFRKRRVRYAREFGDPIPRRIAPAYHPAPGLYEAADEEG